MKAFLVLLALASLPASAQKPEQEEPLTHEQKKAVQTALEKAGLPMGRLLDQSNDGMRWTWRNLQDIVPTIEAASEAVRKLHERYPSAVADAYANGTMTNIEDTFKLFGGGNLERGCISHQGATFAAVKPLLQGKSVVVKKIRYGLPPMQHNAVILFPKGTDWMYSGIVYDGWKRQKHQPSLMTFTYDDWGPIRPVMGIHIEPRPWKANVQLLDDNE